MKPAVLLFCSMLLFLILRAQEKPVGEEMSLQSDNDNFALHIKDGYYTNGFFFRYNYLPRQYRKRGILEKITSYYCLGQEIYTSESIHNNYIWEIDRPFTAHLFLEKGFRFFLRTGAVAKVSLSAGVTGKAALGQTVQDTYHSLLGLVHSNGWYYELNSAAAINMDLSWFSPIMKTTAEKPDLMISFQLRGGTAFTDVTTGMFLRLGKKNHPSASSYYDARIGVIEPGKEIFFYFYPRLRYQFFNATVQGGAFIKDKGFFTASLHPWQWIQEAGVQVARARWTFQAALTVQEKEARSMRKNVWFGTLGLKYRCGDHRAKEKNKNNYTRR